LIRVVEVAVSGKRKVGKDCRLSIKGFKWAGYS
jgi:hypothetical protein